MNGKLRAAVAVLALAGFAALIYQSYGGKSEQMATAADGAAPVGRAMVEITMPPLEGEAAIGARAFQAKCAACHGENAVGQVGVAPPLIHRIYEPSHHGDAAFLLAARNGARAHHWKFGPMPPVKGITNAEIKSIVAFVRTIQRANGIN